MFLQDILKRPVDTLLPRITCFFWLIAKLVGWKVWLSSRLFPVIPPIEAFRAPEAVHVSLLVISVICLASAIVIPNKKILLLLLIAELFSCVLDQNRWQPWEYQYLFMLFIFIIYKNKAERIAASIACILIGTYFYSAASKFNGGFLFSVWDYTILRRYFKLSEGYTHNNVIHYAGYALPVIELACSLGLMFALTKKPAIYILTAMHVFILFLLGPIGLDYNKVIWPWNIAMIIFLWMIFKHEINAKLLWKNTSKLVALFWILLPAMNFTDWWDNYLSSNLYSGNTPLMIICVNDGKGNISEGKFFNKTNVPGICKDGYTLSIQSWALTEMNVPPYPEERIYRAIKKEWLNKYPSLNTTFYLKPRLYMQPTKPYKLFTGRAQYKKL